MSPTIRPLLSLLVVFTALSGFQAQLIPNNTGRACDPGRYDNGNVCLRCPINSISTKPGSFQCQKCPEGLTSNIERTACGEKLGCAPGYHMGRSRTKCYDCSRGSFSTSYSSLKCTSCPTNFTTTTYTSYSSSNCFNCGKGLYVKTDGYNRCYSCFSGQYQDEYGHLECKPCLPGTGYIQGEDTHGYNPTSPADCPICPAGTYSVVRDLISVCETCPDRTYSDYSRSSECKQCPPNSKSSPDRTYCILTCDVSQEWYRKSTCPPGTEPDMSSAEFKCKRCPVGEAKTTYSNSTCVSCGDLRPNEARSKCICQEGKGFIDLFFGNKNKWEDCPHPELGLKKNGRCACPEGKILTLAGTCDCPVGFQEKDGECVTCNKLTDRSCQKCPGGTYYNENRNMCVPCPAGTTSDNPNTATKCSRCKPGYTTPTGQKLCGCKRGHEQKNDKCVKCPAGYAGEWKWWGAFGCKECGYYEYSDIAGLEKCKMCPKGRRYGQNSPSTECARACPTNELPNYSGSGCECKPNTVRRKGKCVPCTAGCFLTNERCRLCERNFISQTGSTGCRECPRNSFSFQRGGTTCHKCPRGFFLTNDKKCKKCRSGYRVRNGVCVKCLDNFVSDGGDVGFCKPCPPNKKPSIKGRFCV